MARRASHSGVGGPGLRKDLLRGTVNSVGSACSPDKSPAESCVMSSPRGERAERPREDFLGLIAARFVVRSISASSFQTPDTSSGSSSCIKDPCVKKPAGSGDDPDSESISIDASPFSLKAAERLKELRRRTTEDAPG